MKEKYQTCKHVEKIGQTAVYVTPGCPRANMIRGHLVSTKTRCRKCRRWEGENAGVREDPGRDRSRI